MQEKEETVLIDDAADTATAAAQPIQKNQLYEGKAKRVFETDDPALVIVSYKDDATAFDGTKKGTIRGKGVVNNRMSNHLMQYLSQKGIPTHYVKELSPTDTLVKKVEIVPLEVIVRNVSAGSFAKRYGVEEGIEFAEPTFEFSYKNDDLHDPLLNTSHALALGLATPQEVEQIRSMALQVNEELKAYFAALGVRLIDFKLEFGRTTDGELVLADEISPDTCRFWDMETGEKLDKDRFRRDLGNVEDAYQEMMRRVFGDTASEDVAAKNATSEDAVTEDVKSSAKLSEKPAEGRA